MSGHEKQQVGRESLCLDSAAINAEKMSVDFLLFSVVFDEAEREKNWKRMCFSNVAG